MTKEQDSLQILEDLLNDAKKAGADAADAIMASGASVDLEYRMGKIEHLERSEGGRIGLRVFIGKKQAIVSSSDKSKKALKDLVEKSIAMARAVPEDPYCGIAGEEQIIKDIPKLDVFDPSEPNIEELIEQAKTCEEAALAIDKVNNSKGSEAGWGQSLTFVAATNGLARSYKRSSNSVGICVVAEDENGNKERDYDSHSAVYRSDLKNPIDIGKNAGLRAVKRLGSKKISSAQMPVIFEPRTATSLTSHFLGAINGAAIARESSFLKDYLGKQIFKNDIKIIDNPLRPRGYRSRPCDVEGIATKELNLIENGILTSWLLDLRSARQLGLKSTGHASRGMSSPPSPSSSNVHLEKGKISAQDMIKNIDKGIYITELVGQGVNLITGDYSRGASGFMIENGKITYPISEITIAGNLKDMFYNLTPADDLDFIFPSVNSPSIMIEGMTIAGN